MIGVSGHPNLLLSLPRDGLTVPMFARSFLFAGHMDLGNLLDLYYANKRNAEKRGITYTLTFKQWHDAWGERILIRNRGQGDKRLRLERIDKSMGYTVGNVHLTTRQLKQRG